MSFTNLSTIVSPKQKQAEGPPPAPIVHQESRICFSQGLELVKLSLLLVAKNAVLSFLFDIIYIFYYIYKYVYI